MDFHAGSVSHAFFYGDPYKHADWHAAEHGNEYTHKYRNINGLNGPVFDKHTREYGDSVFDGASDNDKYSSRYGDGYLFGSAYFNGYTLSHKYSFAIGNADIHAIENGYGNADYNRIAHIDARATGRHSADTRRYFVPESAEAGFRGPKRLSTVCI